MVIILDPGRYARGVVPAAKRIPKPKAPLQRRLGRVIRATREQADLSQERLAELASLSTNYVGNVERGEHDLSVSVLNRIAGALRCKASDVLRAAGY